MFVLPLLIEIEIKKFSRVIYNYFLQICIGGVSLTIWFSFVAEMGSMHGSFGGPWFLSLPFSKLQEDTNKPFHNFIITPTTYSYIGPIEHDQDATSLDLDNFCSDEDLPLVMLRDEKNTDSVSSGFRSIHIIIIIRLFS